MSNIENFPDSKIIINSQPQLDSVSFGIWLVGTFLGKTWRPQITTINGINPLIDPGKGNIYTIWHSNILALAYIFRKSNISAMVSSSKDGKRAAAIAAKWNYNIVYGSSSRRGFSAYRQCQKLLKANGNIVITPDGPKGPKEIVKEGVAHLSFLSKSPVIPLSAEPKRFWRLKSWDRMIIPKPFSRIKISVGEIINPTEYNKSEEGIEMLRRRIEENLHAITMA